LNRRKEFYRPGKKRSGTLLRIINFPRRCSDEYFVGKQRCGIPEGFGTRLLFLDDSHSLKVAKHLDKSSIKYRGTAVPKELLVFFDLDSVPPTNTLNAVFKKNKSLGSSEERPFAFP
jgi:hypothetical protein